MAAYTRGYRYTKDIDLVTDKPAVGKLKGLLGSLGYSMRDTEFGLAGSKQVNQDSIDLHIGVGKVHDLSSGKHFPVPPRRWWELARVLGCKSGVSSGGIAV